MHAAGLPVSITYAWLRHFHARSRAVMCGTPAIRDRLAERGFENLVLWSRGVDTALFTPAPREPRERERPIFLYAGRVAVEKNIEAFCELELPGTKWVVGDGPARARLQSEYPDVRFFGMKHGRELAAFYQQADVFVFPSRTDTFGLVLIEAMACGTPVAAFPVTGPLDVVTDPCGRRAVGGPAKCRACRTRLRSRCGPAVRAALLVGIGDAAVRDASAAAHARLAR